MRRSAYAREMFETFTADAREAIECAQREARSMGHGTVEIEHLLVGLLGCENDVLKQVWTDFGLAIQPARDVVGQRLGVAPSTVPEGRLAFSQAAKDALRSAYRFGMGEPEPAHLLIVLTRRGEGRASEVLRALGADPNHVRADTKKQAFPREEPGPSLRGASRTRLLEDLDFGDL
jgi:ATP-dependent Clp protease ATP-binding subunit ClpA